MLVLSIPDEMGQIGMTSKNSTQNRRFGYKQHFSTHLVNLGIWQGIYIQFIDEAVFTEKTVQTDISTPLPRESAVIKVGWNKRFNMPFDEYTEKEDIPSMQISAIGLENALPVML